MEDTAGRVVGGALWRTGVPARDRRSAAEGVRDATQTAGPMVGGVLELGQLAF